MFLLCTILGILMAASLLAAIALISAAMRGGGALPGELQEKPLTDEHPATCLPQSAAGGLAAGEAADA